MEYSSLGRNLIALVTFSVMVISTFGCNNKSADRHSGENRIRADSHAFSLVPPQGWIRENTPPNILTFKDTVNHGFAANLTVGAANYSGRPAVKDFPEKMRADLPSRFTIVDDGFMIIDEEKAYFVRSSVTIDGLELLNIQYFLPRGRTMYSISFASAASAFDRYDSTLQSMLSSVRAD